MKYGGTEAATNEMRQMHTKSESNLRAEPIFAQLGSAFGFAAGDRGPEARRLGVPEAAPYPSPASAPTTASTAGLDARTGRARAPSAASCCGAAARVPE